jgi:GNAT superfamily N-acetyltransferase
MADYEIRKAKEMDLLYVEALQKATHLKSVNDAEKEQQGFVSVETDIPLLSQINGDIGILVAEADERIVGYEVPLGLEHAAQIPLLDPFVERFTRLDYEGQKIGAYRWVIEGQINVDKAYKRQGIAEELHRNFVEMLRGKYDLIVTEISDQNPRSLHVHTKKLGLSVVDEYNAEGRNWYVLLQDIREGKMPKPHSKK